MKNMKKIRFISRDNIKEAYRRGDNIPEDIIENREEDEAEKIDRLPEETFEIIAKLVSFIEVANKLEGEENEDQ